MIVRVKNLHGTSDRVPSDGSSSWKEFWEKTTGKSFSSCANLDCQKDAELGGHVIKTDDDMRWYIVPICAKCNALDNPYYVDTVNTVPVR